MLVMTSVLSMERIEPKRYAFTSVFNPDVMELIIIPRASELVEITAIEASPFILVFELIFKRKNEARIVTGIAITRGLAFKAKAIAIEPNPTWLNPSPIIE